MQIRQIVPGLIKTFERPGNAIPIQTKEIFSEAIEMLRAAVSKEQGDASLRQECDIILVGAMIYVMAATDCQYGLDVRDKFYYKIPLGQGVFTVPELSTIKQVIDCFGRLALIERTIPFTGTDAFPSDICSELAEILPKDHFAHYGLNESPETIDTTERSSLVKAKEAAARAEREKKAAAEEEEIKQEQKKLRLARNKWIRPFGWPQETEDSGFSSPLGFDERRRKVVSAVERQEHRHTVKLLKRVGWGIIAFFSFFILTPFSLFFTVPFLIRKTREDASSYSKEPLRKLTFTIQEYEEVLEKRRQVKELMKTQALPNEEELEEEEKPARKRKKTCVAHDNMRGEKTTEGAAKEEFEEEEKPVGKFKKICVAYDNIGRETTTRKTVSKVVMYCDREQAKRWDIKFFKSYLALHAAGQAKQSELETEYLAYNQTKKDGQDLRIEI